MILHGRRMSLYSLSGYQADHMKLVGEDSSDWKCGRDSFNAVWQSLHRVKLFEKALVYVYRSTNP